MAQPDVFFVSKARSAILGDRVQGAPDLVIEVTSSQPARDRVRERRMYARFGVPHYWLLDPDARVLEELVLEPAAGDRPAAYRSGAIREGDEVLHPTLFPGLEIRLAEIWA